MVRQKVRARSLLFKKTKIKKQKKTKQKKKQKKKHIVIKR